jgi:hypothetical protein
MRTFLPLGAILVSGAVFAACAASNDGRSSRNGSGSGGSSAGGGVGTFVGSGGSTTSGDACKVPPDTDDGVVPTCDEKAPADAFAPSVQWEWTAPNASSAAAAAGSFVTPLVGNFTDDNGDGEVDLCDIPDILVSAVESFDFGSVLPLTSTARLYLLSGDTGTEHFSFSTLVDGFVYPAFGDVDGDALPEVVAADPSGRLVIFEHDGSLKLTGDLGGYRSHFSAAHCTAIALYDLDGDGSVEILFGFEVFDAQGQRLWGVPGNASQYDGQYWCVTPTAADLDGDGKLEVLFGHETYHHDGSLYWTTNGQPPSHPQVADLDGDGEPEVFLTNANGITVTEADGTLKFGPIRPTDPNPGPNCWGKPAVVHDFDGNGVTDIAAATCTDYTVYQVSPSGLSIAWSNNVQDLSGLATATAFDFLGDAGSEAIYADETLIHVFDGESGLTVMTAPRTSGTLIEYPVVADVDNDASAEIVYVSNTFQGQAPGATLTVLRDAEERWIPARRIWNQYSYHVTNVREDGIIPAQMKKSWLNLNTFRTNSQISAEGDCAPETPE